MMMITYQSEALHGLEKPLFIYRSPSMLSIFDIFMEWIELLFVPENNRRSKDFWIRNLMHQISHSILIQKDQDSSIDLLKNQISFHLEDLELRMAYAQIGKSKSTYIPTYNEKESFWWIYTDVADVRTHAIL